MDADVLDLIILFDLVDLLHFTLFPSILVDTYCWDPFYHTVKGLASISILPFCGSPIHGTMKIGIFLI